MKREIKFRGKTKGTKEWVCGDLSTAQLPNVFVFPVDGLHSPDYYQVDPESVGQYINVIDQEKNELYSGDIVNVYNSRNNIENVGYIKWSDYECGFIIHIDKVSRSWNPRPSDDGLMLKRVGNIIDNPDLIKTKES